MLVLEMTRSAYTTMGTLGTLMLPNGVELLTLERPWIPSRETGSKPFESCIPDGRYEMQLHDTDRYPDTWALVNPDLQVTHYRAGRPGRWAILFHSGNHVGNTDGCILVGLSLSIQNNAFWLSDSERAMHEMRRALEGIGPLSIYIAPTEGAVYGETP